MQISSGFGLNGVVFDLYKNNEPIIESPKSECLTLFLIIFLTVIAINVIGKIL